MLFDYYFCKFSFNQMLIKKLCVKNIIWDVDGTLANINHAYYCFIKNHPKINTFFKNFLYKDLDKALPIDNKYGAIELKTHPILGKQLDELFCKSDEYYFDRPLYYGTDDVLYKLNNMKYKQFILSAGFDIKQKKKLLTQLFSNFPFIKLEVVLHDKKAMHNGDTKRKKIIALLKKYNLKADETVLIDDRIYNIYAGLKAGIKVIHFRSEFTTKLPPDLSNVPEIRDIRQLIS